MPCETEIESFAKQILEQAHLRTMYEVLSYECSERKDKIACESARDVKSDMEHPHTVRLFEESKRSLANCLKK